MKLISPEQLEKANAAVAGFLTKDVSYIPADLSPLVESFIKRKHQLMELADTHRTPYYVFDRQNLRDSLVRFSQAFKKYIPDIGMYYAVKTNHYHELLREVVQHGYGLDVSSVRELQLAQDAGCQDLVFTGPGKTVSDIAHMISAYGETALLNMDSFGELKRAKQAASAAGKRIRAGIRIYTGEHGSWNKFGIQLAELDRFWKKAEQSHHIDMCAIQFHLSWNADAKKYVSVIRELATYLSNSFTKQQRASISIIDFGGGFRPYMSEGFYPENTPQGSVLKTVLESMGETPEFTSPHFLTEALPVEEYAKQIGEAIDTYLRPVVDARYITEPGRVLSNGAMHVLMRVIDKKSDDAVILDGGINILGWERFEYDYVPMINLSRPSTDERECLLYGPLCMPQDSWGNYYFGEGIEEGDILLAPYQGTLTYSLAQNFIKPIPEVVSLP